MSDYAKPTKKCVDAPFGFRTANQLAENQDATRELLELEHTPPPEQPPFATGFGDIGGGSRIDLGGIGIDITQGGQHNTPKVARGSFRLEFYELYAIGSDPIRVAQSTGVCSRFVRLGVGAYFFPVTGLTEFDAQVWPLKPTSASTLRVAQQTPAIVDSAQGVYVSLWEQATLTSSNLGFALTDFSFQVVVYGFTEETVQAPAATLAKVPTRFAPGPMRWWPSKARGRR